ncbi:DUF2249 domain-containing protein [Paenibacillus sp. TRM 82003]|nr:DUF2249 domain-containing protein [Paenibacillus sp. TRM 82003]
MTETIVQLDVRPYLRKKREPFQLIMNAVNGLAKEEVLLLHATFKPTPLLGLLKMKGYANRVETTAPDHWMVAFLHKSQGKARLASFDFGRYAATAEATLEEEALLEEAACDSVSGLPAFAAIPDTPVAARAGKTLELDNRGLEPPQPMVRTLKALEALEPGDRVHIHNDRVPMFLIEELQALGYRYRIETQPDGSAKVEITKA